MIKVFARVADRRGIKIGISASWLSTSYRTQAVVLSGSRRCYIQSQEVNPTYCFRSRFLAMKPIAQTVWCFLLCLLPLVTAQFDFFNMFGHGQPQHQQQRGAGPSQWASQADSSQYNSLSPYRKNREGN